MMNIYGVVIPTKEASEVNNKTTFGKIRQGRVLTNCNQTFMLSLRSLLHRDDINRLLFDMIITIEDSRTKIDTYG